MRIQLLTIIFLSITWLGCKNASIPAVDFEQIGGETMGTYYKITFQASGPGPTKSDIDSQLFALNNALSTYIPSSIISSFNYSNEGIDLSTFDSILSHYFIDNYIMSVDINQATSGYFDPTVMPLVNYWGFGYEERVSINPSDSFRIDSLLQLVGLDKILIDTAALYIKKQFPGVQLDFSAIAKGYAIDILANWLETDFGIANYLVDIGGESRGAGVNPSGNPWRTGISVPIPGSSVTTYDHIVALDNMSVATSGNYRNFYELDGRIISHTMNPKTGFYERNRLLSVTILSNQCALSDAYATACMSMGFEAAKRLVEEIPEIEALFIYMKENNTPDWYATEGMERVLTHRSKNQ